MKKNLLVFASLLLLFSCSDENLSSVGGENVGTEDLNVRSSYNVTYDDAVNMALNAPELFKTAQTKGGEKKIGECLPILSGVPTKGGSADTLVYLINYADGQGFTFVPKDSRKGGYIAYSDNGSFSIADTAANKLTKYLYESIISYCKAEVPATKGSDAAFDGEYRKYSGNFENMSGDGCSKVGQPNLYFDVEPTYADNLPDMGDYYDSKGCTATIGVSEFIPGNGINPLLTTSWGQGYPYNERAPLISGKRALAGCVSVAVAQIVAYKNFPSVYPQGAMADGMDLSGKITNLHLLREKRYANTSNQGGGPGFRDYVSTLYRYIGDVLGNQWGLDVTLAYADQVPACLYRLGYSRGGATYRDYNRDKLIYSLDYNRPVLISAQDVSGSMGHAWVIDGYRYLRVGISKFYFDENGRLDFRQDTFGGPEAPQFYVNCNFGWNGKYNGFYADGIFDTNDVLVETKSKYHKARMVCDIYY